ncbi:MAG: hypothetical protein FWG70_04120 [Oscillospiraceae bacterium]|nr:hypothetical protein [Oscillospiraceae bacterium]
MSTVKFTDNSASILQSSQKGIVNALAKIGWRRVNNMYTESLKPALYLLFPI